MKRRKSGPVAKATPRRNARKRLLVACGVVVIIALGAWARFHHGSAAPIASERHVPRPRGRLTFNRDIAPVMHQHCSGCHHAGGVGPFSLVTYEEIKEHARDIVSVTGRRYMPPWLPEPGEPAMTGERRLTEDEIGILRQWASEGLAEGAPGDKPMAPTWTEDWQLGAPDLVAELPQAYELPADGRDVYRNFVLPLSVEGRRFVRAMEFKPGTKVLHHAFIRFDRTRQSRRRDAEDAEIGFGGMALPPSVEAPGGYFLSWQPGRGPTRSAAGMAWALEAHSDLILQAHMQPSGKPERVRPKIGFYFTDQPPTNIPSKLVLSSLKIDIPAGARDYEIRDSYVLPVAMAILAVLPHAHYLAGEMHGTAVLPTGERRSLLKIKAWDFNWQSDYQYQEPIHLPKGTRIDMRFTYDNSSSNVRNPHQPPVRVGYGAGSTDEMGELWFQVLPGSPAERRIFNEDNDRRLVLDAIEYNEMMLRENPTNAHAHVQLGKAFVNAGRSGEALNHFRRAVQLNPIEEEGHYHIGVLLMRSDPAIAEAAFLQTIHVNPENFKARNNLGLMMMNSGRPAEAEVQFRAALELNPNDKLILDNLRLLQKR